MLSRLSLRRFTQFISTQLFLHTQLIHGHFQLFPTTVSVSLSVCVGVGVCVCKGDIVYVSVREIACVCKGVIVCVCV